MLEVGRAEHLAFAKERALEYVEIGDGNQAWTSFANDLNKHSELCSHAALRPGHLMMFAGDFTDPAAAGRYIESIR